MLPDRGPFSIYDFSSWARGSTVPLIALFDRKPVYGPTLDARRTLRRRPRERALRVARAQRRLRSVLLARRRPAQARRAQRSSRSGARASRARRSGRSSARKRTGDWGGIIPAMLNAMLALRALGYAPNDPVVVRGWAAIDGFTITEEGAYRVQPCISPVWDTGLAVRALVDAGVPRDDERLVAAVRLADREADRLDVRRLGGEEPRRQARRLGVRVRERVVSRRRRHARSSRWRSGAVEPSRPAARARRARARARNGSRRCSARPAAGARSTSTTIKRGSTAFPTAI